MNEYSNNYVNGSPCNYSSLGNYTTAYNLGNISSPNPSTIPVKVVPPYGAPGYLPVSHGSNTISCSGYFNQQNAYPSHCNRFQTKLCNERIKEPFQYDVPVNSRESGYLQPVFNPFLYNLDEENLKHWHYQQRAVLPFAPDYADDELTALLTQGGKGLGRLNKYKFK